MFYHGVEILEVDSGNRPIQTASASIIGVVGTAPESQPAIPATVSDGGIIITSVSPGSSGNGIVVNISVVTKKQSISVIDKKNQVFIELSSDANTDDLILAINDGSRLVTAKKSAGVTKNAIPSKKLVLIGGQDEPFPINKPVLISASQIEAGKLGTSGTLPAAMGAIFKQCGAFVVVVRIEQAETDEQTITNAIGTDGTDGNFSGIGALISSESITGVCPKILICPEFSKNKPVADALVFVADRLRGVAIVEGNNTNDSDVIAYRRLFSSKRLIISDPDVLTFSTTEHREIIDKNSPYVAGLMSRIDNNRGFWWSPSNQIIHGISGTARPIDFSVGDANSRANLLNANDVSTIVQQDGFRFWGNRTCSDDPKWSFINVVRTSDILNDSLQRAHLWAIDRCLSKTYISEIQNSVNAFIRSLIARGALLGGFCWPDPELNTPSNLSSGKVYFNFDFTVAAPAEHITFCSILTDDYYSIIGEAA